MTIALFSHYSNWKFIPRQMKKAGTQALRAKITGVVGIIVFLSGMSASMLPAQTASTPSTPAQTTSSATASTRDGVYTAEQAQQGKTLYTQLCIECHGASLEGMGQNPSLTGDDFLNNWQGQTLADLFTRIRTTMPALKPGSLTPAETALLVAYILDANTFPSGKTVLPADPVPLKAIHIDAPQAKP
ncbi:MAG: c-type cytochrome [Acidobacteriaceae bacterium]